VAERGVAEGKGVAKDAGRERVMRNHGAHRSVEVCLEISTSRALPKHAFIH